MVDDSVAKSSKITTGEQALFLTGYLSGSSSIIFARASVGLPLKPTDETAFSPTPGTTPHLRKDLGTFKEIVGMRSGLYSAL